jgi:NDP-sugar pyrophosphorylase family protein
VAHTSIRDVRAVILAGGRGARLQPLTAVFPKPLVPLGNKPILEILLRRLVTFGLTEVTLCTGYLSELLMAVFGDGSKLGVKIRYSREESPLGTAGALAMVDDLTDPFLVLNGDLLTTLEFNRMLEYHEAHQADITVGTFQRDVRIDLGVIESDEQGRFVGYREKPTYHFEVSMGVNVLRRRVTERIEPNKPLDMPDLIAGVHASGGKVCCYREDCYWLDIGRMDDYALAQEQYAQNEQMFLGRAP